MFKTKLNKKALFGAGALALLAIAPMTLASTAADAASVSIYLGGGYGPYVGGPYVRAPYVRGPYAHPYHPGWHEHHRYHGPVPIRGWNRYDPHFHPRPAYRPVYDWR